jgi:hypothetical protein
VAPKTDEILRAALKKAYLTRAKLFVEEISKRGVQELIDFLSHQDSKGLHWNLDELGITGAAFAKVKRASISPHLFFCHPIILGRKTKLIDYYRNLSAVSNKGLDQMLSGLKGPERNRERVYLLNNILSSIVEDMAKFDLALARSVIPAEIGAEIQGTWVNIIGQGAAKQVHDLLMNFAREKNLIESEAKDTVVIRGKKRTRRKIILKNGWSFVFSDEPDVAISDKKGLLRVAIEIKGSMDKAGAQTRYGEAKKSFTKAISENSKCETIYLASCFTEAVREQITRDGQVRKDFNLLDIMKDETKQKELLEEIFVHQVRILERV